MSLQHGDKLFVFYNNDDIPQNGRFSYFGSDFGTVAGFDQYIDGYIFAVDALYNYYISCDSYRNDILDTIIYPLCFNYRQIIELKIKYLYFKYSVTDERDKENFVKRVSHKLNKAWLEVKPYLLPLLTRMNSSMDMTLFDEFIDEIDSFDSDSFRMRYPIKKDLTSVHSAPVKLDVIGLHSKMFELFNMFNQLDKELDGLILNNNYNVDLINNIILIYNNCKDEIIFISNNLAELAEKEKIEHKETTVCSLGDYIQNDNFKNPHSNMFETSINELTSEIAALLGILIQVGREIVDGSCKLSINEKERKKDFFKLIEVMLTACNDFISFDGGYSNSDMCYTLFEKGYVVSSKWLNTSLDIMEKCVENKMSTSNDVRIIW